MTGALKALEPGGGTPQAGSTAASDTAKDPKVSVSDTGQLRWDVSQQGAGYFIADTPRTKLFTGLVRGRTFPLGKLTLKIGKTRLDWATVSMVCIAMRSNSCSLISWSLRASTSRSVVTALPRPRNSGSSKRTSSPEAYNGLQKSNPGAPLLLVENVPE